MFTLIFLDANNDSENREPKYADKVIDNNYFELDKKYDKRNFKQLLLIFFINNDFNNAFLFKSSLISKPLKILTFILTINGVITFNALLEGIKYNSETSSVNIVINVIIIPLIALILSLIFSFILGKLVDCKEDLRAPFIEEEKKMRNNISYKVENQTKIEIKMKINGVLKCFKIKIIFFLLLTFYFSYFLFII